MAKAICNQCGKVYEFHCDDLSWSSEAYAKHSEAMGPEFHHTSEWGESCNCGEALSISFLYVEYPEGTTESKDIETAGCEFQGDCPAPISFR
ncbi:MAG: hypothetical protein HUN04_15690 [Desulfobacter sp.]|nr:MAG: hypothetical protein HUN04_15690 [Desulfobacter sp.]